MAEALVQGEGIGYADGGRWLVRGVDLTVQAGEIVTLIGPNGSGKSTTAKLATGVLRPSEGRLSRKPGLRIGYVPQKLSVGRTLPMTVERMMRLTAQHGPEEITRAMQRTGVDHLARSDVQNLSGGEFQRALLARAILGEPDLLVLDEPVTGVDFSGEVAIYDLIQELRDQTGCGVLLISHDLHIVMAATDTVVCLNGHVCCAGTPMSVAANPEYLKLFGARAAETLAVYQHQHDHTHLPDGRIQHPDGTITDGHGDDHHHGHGHG